MEDVYTIEQIEEAFWNRFIDSCTKSEWEGFHEELRLLRESTQVVKDVKWLITQII